MAIVGYARVSTQDQHLTGQLEALKAAGATTIFREKISGARADRPQLAKLMASLKAGDVVLVTKLDRLGRSTRELLDLIERIGKAGASFRSLGDPLWDTSSSQGRLLSTLLAAIAEFERDLIRERTGDGRKRAQAKRREVRPQAEAVGLPAPGSHQAPRRGRDLGRDRQELRRRHQHDQPVVGGIAATTAGRRWPGAEPRSISSSSPLVLTIGTIGWLMTSKSRAAQLRESRQRDEQLRPIFTELANLSPQAAAVELHKRKVPTPEKRPWSAVMEIRVRRRLGRS